MTYEQQIVLRTLQQVQAKKDNLITKTFEKLKNDDSIKDTVRKLQIDMLDFVELILGCVAEDNGIKIELEERKNNS